MKINEIVKVEVELTQEEKQIIRKARDILKELHTPLEEYRYDFYQCVRYGEWDGEVLREEEIYRAMGVLTVLIEQDLEFGDE